MPRYLSLKEAHEALLDGELVAIPTETVYGLAANALNPKAIAKIFELKQRPAHNPIICHVAHVQAVESYTQNISKPHRRLMQHFWPGPLTLILESNGRIPKIVSAGTPFIGFRIPRHSLCLDLLAACSFPLAAPSANLSSTYSPSSAAMVFRTLGTQGFAGVLDGGPCELGLESAVLRVREDQSLELLRPGSVDVESLAAFHAPQHIKLGYNHDPGSPDQMRRSASIDTEEHSSCTHLSQNIAPGNARVHYRPKIPLVLLLEQQKEAWWRHGKVQVLLSQYHLSLADTCYFSFSEESYERLESHAFPGHIIKLCSYNDSREAAKKIFFYFDYLSHYKPEVKLLFSHLFSVGRGGERERGGLGHAINDRLQRAASTILSLSDHNS